MKLQFTMHTRVRAGSAQLPTEVTVDFTGATIEQLATGHTGGSSLRVWAQSRIREDGIPPVLTVRYLDYLNKTAKPARLPTSDEILEGAKAGTYNAAELIKKLMEMTKNR